MLEFISHLGWRPAIGDPSLMGWLTVIAYAAAAALCFVAARRIPVDDRPAQNRRKRRMWMGIAVLMAFLSINKQLDLQTLLTKIGREVAVRGGWYGDRRIVQLLFVIAVLIAGAAMFVLIVRRTRFIIKERKLLLVGLCFLISFIVVRASSFHHVGVFLGSGIWGVRMNWILELSGIGMIALSAAQSIRHPDL
jgi:hypothetical protein